MARQTQSVSDGLGQRYERHRSNYDREFGRRKQRLSFRLWLRQRAAGSSERRAAERLERTWERESEHLGRDYRDWQRDWQPGMPIGIGSGRRAQWCHIVYLQYALIARLLHERLGWTGQRVRDAAKALSAEPGFGWRPPATPVPVRELLAIGAMAPGRYESLTLGWERNPTREHESGPDDESSVRRTGWQVWLGRVVAPAWGRYMLEHYIERCRRDEGAVMPSLIVGEIRRLRGAEDVTDMRGCSGCEYLDVLPERAELFDWMLSRGAPARRVTLRNGLEAMHVRFGHEYPPEFDHCLVLGMNYELRVRRRDWEALDVQEQTRVLAG